MKPPLRAIVLLAAGCLAGAIAARLYYTQIFDEISEEWLFVTHQGKVLSDADLLTLLRRGDTNSAFSYLEEDLSSEIAYLATTFPKESISDKDCLRILGIAARYRSKHPYRTGEDKRDRLVEEFLSKVQGGDPGRAPASAAEEITPAAK